MARTCLPPAKRAILRPIQLGLRFSTPAAQALLEREVGVGRPLVRNPLARLNPSAPCAVGVQILRCWMGRNVRLAAAESRRSRCLRRYCALFSKAATWHGAEDFPQGLPRRTHALLPLHPARFIQHAIAARTISQIQPDGQLLLRKFLLLRCGANLPGSFWTGST